MPGQGQPREAGGAGRRLEGGRPRLGGGGLTSGGGRPQTGPGAGRIELWVPALAQLVEDGRVSRVELTTIEGEPSASHRLAPTFKAAGFQTGYRGLTLR